MGRHVVFDVIGTLAGYEKFFEAIENTMGARLRAADIGVRAFAFLMIEISGREYTNLSISGRYVESSKIFKPIFWRALRQAGVDEPHVFATEEDFAAISKGYAEKEMRPGATECIQKLRDAGFTVWGLTTGDWHTVRDCFLRAAIDMPVENLKACDEIRIAKPDPESYKPLLKQLSDDGPQPWFAASHLWDTSAAKRTGFRGAYCTQLEGEALLDVFGNVDVVADSLPEMADKIIAVSERQT